MPTSSLASFRAALKDMLLAAVPKLTPCYERALLRNADLSGRWILSFIPVPGGALTEVSVSGEGMRDVAFEACLVAEASTWVVAGEVPPRLSTVKVPVTFSPSP